MLVDQERGYWLAKHIVPNEHLIRAWLARFSDIEADDIIQEGYVIISEANISKILNPIGYFHTICSNLVLRHYRKAQVVSVTAIADILSNTLVDQTPSIEDTLDARAELKFLDQIIQDLPDTCRNVFICRKINGYPQKQCAQELGISENSVEKQLARALTLIAKSYGQRNMDQRKKTGPIRGNRKFS